jgi:hypothetical protein
MAVRRTRIGSAHGFKFGGLVEGGIDGPGFQRMREKSEILEKHLSGAKNLSANSDGMSPANQGRGQLQ